MGERDKTAASKDNMDVLRAGTRKRRTSPALRPRAGVVRGCHGVARASVEDESSPAATPYKS